MPRALSLVLSSSAEPALQAIWSLSPLCLVFTYSVLVNSYYCPQGSLFTASSCPQLRHVTWLPSPLAPHSPL